MIHISLIPQTRKKSKSKSRCFIPPYYEFNPQSLGNNYYVKHNNDGTVDMFVKPIIRVILLDIKNMVVKGQESLSRQIKDKMDSNSRLLIKNGMSQNLPMVNIKGENYVHVNCSIYKISDTKFRVMNERKYSLAA